MKVWSWSSRQIITGLYANSFEYKRSLKQSKQKYDDIPNYKIGDLVMIKSFGKKSN